MKIVITGGAGYIGSQLAFLLVDRGYNVLIIDNFLSSKKVFLPKSVEVLNLNIGSGNKITKILKDYLPNFVIHLAASVEVEESVLKPMEYYQNNVVNSINFLNSCLDAQVKNLIFSSTAAVYGPKNIQPLKEGAEKDPSSPYGHSKLIIEKVINDISKSKLINSIIFRYFNVAGADRKMRTGQIKDSATHLIKVACEVATGKREIIKIFGNDYATYDGTCIRDYIHVCDLADLHLCAINYLINGGKSITLNCGYGKGFSVLEVINTIKKISQKEFLVEFSKRRPGDLKQTIADVGLCKKTFNWKPKYDSLKSIIQDAYEWEKLN